VARAQPGLCRAGPAELTASADHVIPGRRRRDRGAGRPAGGYEPAALRATAVNVMFKFYLHLTNCSILLAENRFLDTVKGEDMTKSPTGLYAVRIAANPRIVDISAIVI
jgi:hypothetical protein